MQSPEVLEMPKLWSKKGEGVLPHLSGSELSRLEDGIKKINELRVRKREFFERQSEVISSVHLMSREGIESDSQLKILSGGALIKRSDLKESGLYSHEYEFISLNEAEAVLKRSIEEMSKGLDAAKETLQTLRQ